MDEVELSFERKQNLSQIVVNWRQMQCRILTKSIFYIFTVAMIAIKILGLLLCEFLISTQWIQRPKCLFGILNSELKQKISITHGECENFCWKPKYVASNYNFVNLYRTLISWLEYQTRTYVATILDNRNKVLSKIPFTL